MSRISKCDDFFCRGQKNYPIFLILWCGGQKVYFAWLIYTYVSDRQKKSLNYRIPLTGSHHVSCFITRTAGMHITQRCAQGAIKILWKKDYHIFLLCWIAQLIWKSINPPRGNFAPTDCH